MHISLTIGETALTGTLLDTPAARDFYALLPLQVLLSDFAQAEKIANLPKELSLSEAAAGCVGEPGDIAYYAPWGNLAIFYRHTAYAIGLVKLGALTGDLSALLAADGDTVCIRAQ
ncbi:cyclophilin-like fold protein [Pseudoalteromonas ruthenica]|uniref:cyclophilin-like fold protein n=1 Tax=Pseudoalteromonas ruthenica TaxID=151081 RepID=UPI00034A04EA|nr:cyclophilin-like fold protein [Pseudoalteromonas ruthenica]